MGEAQLEQSQIFSTFMNVENAVDISVAIAEVIGVPIAGQRIEGTRAT